MFLVQLCVYHLVVTYEMSDFISTISFVLIMAI